jgi:general secretion pathway protein G
MRYQEQDAATRRRGDTVKVVRLTGHRVAMSASSEGFTLIELVITIVVLTILSLGIIPLVKVSVKRQREQQLRDALREMRLAIDEFHRDTLGMNCSGGTSVVAGGAGPPTDPRSRVMISDCTIFGVDNPDRYPPTLETLQEGVNVIPRTPPAGGGGLGTSSGTSTLPTLSQLSTKKKVYLRAIPIDPMTGEKDWDLRSCYDTADTSSWGGENVFDVRSKSKGTALNGEKYSDW